MTAVLRPWRVGLLGLPLAFLALPLYVSLPPLYAAEYGVPLAQLGLLLLAVRLADAFIDPLIGRASEHWLRPGRVGPVFVLAAVLMLVAFVALFQPPLRGSALLPFAALMLLLAYLAYSVLSVSHQAWVARLGGSALAQTRLVAWREGLALAGVLLASVLMVQAGWVWTSALLGLMLAAALVALLGSPLPQATPGTAPLPWRTPWRIVGFRRLMAVHAVNGIASAIPATLLLFFVRDRLQASEWEAAFLLAYFAAAAGALPLWLRAVARWGQVRAWQLGMGLAIGAFVWAALLGAGDRLAFLLVCLASGAAAGADLAIAPALLQRVLAQSAQAGRIEGVCFGWWNALNKLNLALAAGLTLPLLALLGYQPGTSTDTGALALTYAALPCLLKLFALGLLMRFAKELR
jgi:GPH family glycoside/pentoside/hexuronide:cation symporter